MTDDKRLQLQEMIREAKKEAKKGVFISHEAVEKWVESLGTEHELPPPKPDAFKN